MKKERGDSLNQIDQSGDLNDELLKSLEQAVKEYKDIFRFSHQQGGA